MSFIEKYLKGEFRILGKTIPAFLITSLLAIGTVAALLTVYITITGSTSVSQSVILNDFESSWKYDATTDWGDTWATWSVDTMVGGDEQDVGFLISNYAEISADLELVASTTGPQNGYEECNDVMVTFWDDYMPHDAMECTEVTMEENCLTENGCVWEEGYCWGDEKCTGSEISSTCVGDVTTAYATVLERPDMNDPNTPGEDWFCIRYEFDIAAAPGDYNFNLDVNPDI